MSENIEELLAWLDVATQSDAMGDDYYIKNEGEIKASIRRILSAWPEVEALERAVELTERDQWPPVQIALAALRAKMGK